MTISFLCPACGLRHPSRLRARTHREWLGWVPHLGDVLELCPLSQQWVPIHPVALLWFGDVRPEPRAL